MERNGVSMPANVRMAVEFRWGHLGQVERDADGELSFPSTGYIPGVYRFRVIGDGTERHYIGEASELRRRFQQYRTPGSSQQTNLRLNRVFRDHLEGGGRIEVDVAESVQLGSDGRSPADLNEASVRKLVESAGIVAGKTEGLATLNR